MKKGFLILLGLIAVVLLSVNVYINSKLPIRDGQLQLSSLSQPVTVVFDKWAIPHIEANTELDMFRALGFVHAQDRLFQMDVLRRVGKGELAALLGEPAVKVDKLFRTLGTREFSLSKAKNLRETQPDKMPLLDAYYDGVNQAIAKLATPVEYDILGVKPEPFSIEDGYAIFSYVAHSFTGGLSIDPVISALQVSLPKEHFNELVMAWPETVKTNTQTSALAPGQLVELANNSEQLVDAMPFGPVHGSNAWAIAPKKSASGKTLLANDPHIAFASPSVWYEAQIRSGDINLYGHFMAGVPFPLLIRTEYLAQGVTMLQSDDADLIALQYNENNSQVMIEGNWQPVSKRQEVISVKGAEAVQFEVVETPVGPIVNEALNLSQQQPIALYWLYTKAQNKPFNVIHGMYRATDMASMELALSAHWSPGLNMVYADADNNIAQWAVGRFIQRPEGNNGKVIVDGTKPNTVPLGVYPFSNNPKIINPDSGYVFTTNHAFTESNPNVEHAGYYSPIHRALWADEKLAEGNSWNNKKMQALQIETTNMRAVHLLKVLKQELIAGELNGKESEAWQELRSWDGKYTINSVSAAIFERFYFHLFQQLYADEMGEELFASALNKSFADNSFYEIVHNPESVWWDNIATAEQESRQQILQQTFSHTVTSLAKEYGADISKWQWRKMASLTHKHPLGRVAILDKLFNVGPFEVLGSRRALNNMISKYNDGDIIVTNGPSTRRVMDFSDPKMGFTVLPTGQSGIVFDQHYDSQTELFHSNKYREATMLDKGQVPESATTLMLTP